MEQSINRFLDGFLLMLSFLPESQRNQNKLVNEQNEDGDRVDQYIFVKRAQSIFSKYFEDEILILFF